MNVAEQRLFPGFLPDVPQAPTALQKGREMVRDIVKSVDENGALMPQVLAAKSLGVSKARVYDLIEEGTLKAVNVCGRRLVTEESVRAYSDSERKAGRPPKLVRDASEKGVFRACFGMAKEVFQEGMAEQRKR